MELVDFLVALVVGIGCMGAIAWIVSSNNTKRLRASSPPGAGVVPADAAAVVRAKRSTYRRLTEAVRIMESVLRQDALVPILEEQTRQDIAAFLDAFYDES